MGIGSTITQILGALGSGQLIVHKFEIEGQTFEGIIDTGATSTFLPRRGRIIQALDLKLEKSKGTIETLGSDIRSSIQKTVFSLRPFNSNGRPIECRALVIDTGPKILGHDILVGLPDLEELNVQITLGKGEPELVWHSQANQISDISNQSSERLQSQRDTNLNRKSALISSTIDSAPNQEHHVDKERCQDSTNSPRHKSTKDSVEEIMNKHKSTFAKSLNGSTIRTAPARIELNHYKPIKCRARRQSKEEIRGICEQISRLERNNIIEVSNSPYASNCRLVVVIW